MTTGKIMFRGIQIISRKSSAMQVVNCIDQVMGYKRRGNPWLYKQKKPLNQAQVTIKCHETLIT